MIQNAYVGLGSNLGDRAGYLLLAVRGMLDGLYGPSFPIQVRHGTAQPQHVFKRLAALGLDATEGGPVSYCMPYSRLPLARAVEAWAQSCQLLADATAHAHARMIQRVPAELVHHRRHEDRGIGRASGHYDLRARFRVPADLLIPPPRKTLRRRSTKRAAA